MASLAVAGVASEQSGDVEAEPMPLSAPELIDLLQESIIVFGPDGQIKRCNKAAEQIYGWPRKEIEGRSFQDVFGASHFPAEEVLQDLDWSRPYHREVCRKASGGRNVYVSTDLSVVRAINGQPLEFLESGFEVTPRDRIETASEAEERHYRNVFWAIPTSVWDIDISQSRALASEWLCAATVEPRQWFAENPDRVRELMRATYARDVSEQALKLFGPCERGDLLVDVERYWPEDCVKDFADWIISSLSGERFFSRETRQRRYNGQEFDALFMANYTSGTIANGRIVACIVDNSEVKRGQAAARKSEAFYRDMFHGSAFAAFHLNATKTWTLYHALYAQGVTDFRAHLAANPNFIDQVMDGIRVVDVNEQAVRLFEARDRTQLIGGSIAPFWFPDHRRETLLQSLEGAFNGIPTYQGLGRMRTLAGNEVHVLFTRSASIALSSAGQVLLAIVDMTDKVRAQNALAEMQSNFAHADRVSSLGQLTASIAHEVNQPLSAITSNGEASLRWLGRTPPDLERVSSSIHDIIADASRASEIVSHIKAMASPQTGQYQQLSLNKIVEDALQLLSSQLQGGGITITFDRHSELPDILGNSIQLQQVVVNLSMNAFQAMTGRSNPCLTLRTSSTAGTVTLEVRDNGPGMATDSLSKLFDSFYTTKADGMGIGLAICRSLVEAHGGIIRAENGPSGGACFTVDLPSLS